MADPVAPSASRRWWAGVRLLGGLAILALLVWRLGTGPFLDGLRTIDARALLLAAAIGVVTTFGCAWRWRLVARGLGVDLPLRVAVAAYYRSLFLNSTLPGGVLGDVHRALRHGRDIGDVGRGVRAVVLERVAGQAVQLAIVVVVLAALPSPVHGYVPVVLAVLAIGLGAAGVATRTLPGRGRWVRAMRGAGADLHAALFARRTGPWAALASVVVVVGHLATFVLAARTAGVGAALTVVVPLGLLALLAMSVPLNVAGWGPREGVAAWAFAAVGLTAAQGVATAVVYGVLAFGASLPGALVLVASGRGRGDAAGAAAAVEKEGAARG